ncbi:MAG: (deoxy)nucleoside triphosphate pyrophosphohydrolase [Candidatus Hydrogenedentales bacterium]
MLEQRAIDGGIATPISIAVVEHDDRFLIGQRPPGVVLTGFWEFPGGKLRDGETADEAAARECREETGIEVEVLGSYGERVHEYDFGWVRLQFFICRPRDVSKQPLPPFRWVPRQDLSRYQFPPANEELLRELQSTTAFQGRRVSRSALEGRPTEPQRVANLS